MINVCAILSIVGAFRKTNEDYAYINRDKSFFAVADGVGSTRNSKQSAIICVKVISYISRKMSYQFFSPDEMRGCLTLASNKIRHLIKKNNFGSTTISACRYVGNNNYYYCHVGDSSIILYRPKINKVIFETKPHTLAGDNLEHWPIRTLNPRTRTSGSNILTRSVGGANQWHFDFGTFSAEQDDIIILASDGTLDAIHPKKIVDIVTQQNFSSACSQIIADELMANKPSDNCSVIIFKHME